MAAPPPRSDHRVILHFDYDCFYASVLEVEQPVLKSLPLAVQQKQIVVTCNYEARRRGLRKLQLISEAKRICPDVVIVLGEDLTKFRDASKDLYLYLRSFVWGDRVERLGFDELFLDVSDMIEHNSGLLNPNNLQNSFFCLSRQDPAVGFAYDATRFHGHTYPSDGEADRLSASSWPDRDQLYVRMLVASHLAGYLRRQLEHDRCYTATVGVSTCKALSKLAGSAHKPDDQTALLPPYDWAQRTESNVIKFLDSHEIRKIPGIGSKIARSLKTQLIESSRLGSSDSGLVDDKITVHDVRHFPDMGPGLLEQILGGPGSSKGIGIRIWNLIYGVDDSEVLEARDFPTQISIEDSYRQLDTFEAVKRELVSLSSNLIRRVRVDLTEKDEDTDSGIRWLAHPRTLRLSTRPKAPPAASGARAHSFNRVSRSAPLPQYVFNLGERVDALGERLVQDLALSMFRKLHPEKSGWSLSLLNVAVSNMVERAGEQKGSNGRDIKQMFQRQETVLKEWKAPEPTPTQLDSGLEVHQGHGVWEESDDDEAIPSVICGRCGASIPHFALVAHEVYHSAGEDEVVDTST